MNGYSLSFNGNITIKNSKNWHYYYIDLFPGFDRQFPTFQEDATNFLSFIRQLHPDVYDQFMEDRIIMAGYENNTPILSLVEQGSFKCVGDFITLDAKCGFGEKYNKEDSCEKVAKIITETILKYAIDNNQTDFIEGMITILKITPGNNFSWLTPIPKREGWRNYKEFYDDYLNGKVNLTFKSDESKEFILKQIKSNL